MQATLARDQDITLEFAALEDVLIRIARLRSSAPGGHGGISSVGNILNRARAMHPEYYVVES